MKIIEKDVGCESSHKLVQEKKQKILKYVLLET